MIEDFYALNPYELNREEKEKMLTKELVELTEYHREHCPEYKGMTDAMNYEKDRSKVIMIFHFIRSVCLKKKN